MLINILENYSCNLYKIPPNEKSLLARVGLLLNELCIMWFLPKINQLIYRVIFVIKKIKNYIILYWLKTYKIIQWSKNKNHILIIYYY